MRARFVILANGILTTPRLARIHGHGDLPGRVVPHRPAGTTTSTSTGKRVGIIGTGATAVQAIPELAKVAGELYVFQRTPSTIDVRDQRATTPGGDRGVAQRAGLGPSPPRPLRQADRPPGHPGQRRLPRRQGRAAQAPRAVPTGRSRPARSGSSASSRRASGSWSRSATGSTPSSRTRRPPRRSSRTTPTAASGRRSTTSTCPRSTCPTSPSSTSPRSACRRSTSAASSTTASQYDLDVLIYATGFDFMATSTFNLVTGRDGRTLAEKWQEEGTRTFLGLHTARLPEPVHRGRPPGRRRQLQLHRRHRRRTATTSCGCSPTMRDERPRRRRRPQGRRGRSGRSTAPRPTSPPRRCGTASRTSTATARPQPGSSPTTAAAGGTSRRIEAQETLEPYVFGSAQN